MQVIALAGVKESFAHVAQRTLAKMAGLRLSESTVERVTEEAGEQLGQQLAAKQTFGPAQDWDWRRDLLGQRCAYVSLDATGVPHQGPGAAKAEGRMAYVGMIYNPRGEYDSRPSQQVRYLAGFYDLDELGLQLRRQAAQVGWDEADQWIALSDGGAGLEPFVRNNFPRAQLILDFWHASEHVAELARTLWPEDEATFQKETATWCHQLKHEGGAALLATLEQLDLTGRTAAVVEMHRLQTNYIRSNLHRTDYPAYLARGWQIGSGPVEAACKRVVNARLKGSGMRWGSDGADALCHLRALWLSEPTQWDGFWDVKPGKNPPTN